MLLQVFTITCSASIGTCGVSYLSNDMQRWCFFGNGPVFETSMLCVSILEKNIDVSQKFGRKLVNVTYLYTIGEPIVNASAMPAQSPLSKASRRRNGRNTRQRSYAVLRE